MLNKVGLFAVVLACIAAGLGFAAYFVEKWYTNGEYYFNIEKYCDYSTMTATYTCNEFDESTKLKANRYLQVAGGPGFAFMSAMVALIKLCCGVNCCIYFAAVNAFLSVGCYVASLIIFNHEHYWTGSERSTYTISWGMVMTPLAALLALIAAILMIVSGIKTRHQFGGKVIDALQVKRSQRPQAPSKRPLPKKTLSNGGRRV